MRRRGMSIDLVDEKAALLGYRSTTDGRLAWQERIGIY